MVCKPCARLVGVNDHTPLALAVVVPSTVEPSLIFTVALGSAVPVSASSAVMCLPPLVSSASAIVSIGLAQGLQTLTASETNAAGPAVGIGGGGADQRVIGGDVLAAAGVVGQRDRFGVVS